MKKSKPATSRLPKKTKRAASPMSKTQKAKAPAEAKACKTAKARVKSNSPSADDSADTPRDTRFELPEIAGWPTMEKAFNMKPGEIRLLGKLESVNPLLTEDTGLQIPTPVRAAYNLAMNFQYVCQRRVAQFQLKVMAAETHGVLATEAPGSLTDDNVSLLQERLAQAYAAIFMLHGLATANMEQMLVKLRETLPETGQMPFFIVVPGYRIVRPKLSPTLSWHCLIPEKYRDVVACYLLDEEIDPLTVQPEILNGILSEIRHLEAAAKTPQSPAKRRKPSKRLRKAAPRKELPKIKKRGPRHPSVPASPSATASSRSDNSVGAMIGFAFDPNAATGKKPKSPV